MKVANLTAPGALAQQGKEREGGNLPKMCH